MITRIKRVAQFLFDNADIIAEYMRQSDNYRTVEVDFRVHKTDEEELDIGLVLYDEKGGLHDLLNHTITKARFVQLCNMINGDTEVTPLPELVSVRDKLNPFQVDFSEFEKKVLASICGYSWEEAKDFTDEWYLQELKLKTVYLTDPNSPIYRMFRKNQGVS